MAAKPLGKGALSTPPPSPTTTLDLYEANMDAEQFRGGGDVHHRGALSQVPMLEPSLTEKYSVDDYCVNGNCPMGGPTTSHLATNAEVRIEHNVELDLGRQGFSVVRSTEVQTSPCMRCLLGELAGEFQHLEPDPKDASGTRRRAYARFVYIPSTRALVPLPPGAFVQSAALNPDAGGQARVLASLSLAAVSNPALHALAVAYFEVLPSYMKARLGDCVALNLHFMRYAPTVDHPARSTPQTAHRDGQPITATILIRRQGVLGGTNRILNDAGDELAAFTLTDMLDAFIVEDRKIQHQVEEMTLAEGVREGARDVILIDLLPLKEVAEF